jgi:hypothetical protein
MLVIDYGSMTVRLVQVRRDGGVVVQLLLVCLERGEMSALNRAPKLELVKLGGMGLVNGDW